MYLHPLLTDKDLSALTGYERSADQRRWLQENGIGFRVDRAGRPRTTWHAIDSCLVGYPRREPDFSGVR